MKVPLKNVALFDPQGNQQPLPQEFTDGEATWYVKGQGKRGAGPGDGRGRRQATPRGPAVISVTLVQRRANGGGMNPSNIVQVRYQPGDSGQGAPPAGPASPAPQQPPVQQAPQAQQQQYVRAPYGPPQACRRSSRPAGLSSRFSRPPAAEAAAARRPAAAAAVQQVPAAGASAAGSGAPAQFDAEQAALFARITGQPAA
jgi:hypothetical protein